MKFSFVVFSVCVVVVLFAIMLIVKTDAQALVKERKILISEKEKLIKSLKVLKLEYEYLVRPERLLSFSSRFNYVAIIPEKMEVLIMSNGDK